jgi:hypothetical protein
MFSWVLGCSCLVGHTYKYFNEWWALVVFTFGILSYITLWDYRLLYTITVIDAHIVLRLDEAVDASIL